MKSTNTRSEPIIPVLAAIIFNADQQVLLAQRKTGLSQALKWEFPGGKLKSHEKPEECLQREIKEELGMDIRVETIFHAVNHAYPEKHILLLAYQATLIREGNLRTDHQKICWCPVPEILQFDLSEADIPIAQKLVEEYFAEKAK